MYRPYTRQSTYASHTYTHTHTHTHTHTQIMQNTPTHTPITHTAVLYLPTALLNASPARACSLRPTKRRRFPLPFRAPYVTIAISLSLSPFFSPEKKGKTKTKQKKGCISE